MIVGPDRFVLATAFLAAATCAKGSSFRLNQLRVVVLRAVEPPDDRYERACFQ